MRQAALHGYRALRAPIVGIVLSLGICSLILIAVGESPAILVEAFENTLFTQFGLGYTLFYSTPLILTGLSVAISFHCGLFNIGAEGQLYIGSIAIVIVASLFPNAPWYLGVPVGIATALVAGGLWGGIAGELRARRGSHEVIVTILLNFIALYLVNYLILHPLKNPVSQNPETFPVGAGFQIPRISTIFGALGIELFTASPVNITLFIAIALATAVYLFLFVTPLGYEFRAAGQNPRAAQFAGISITRNQVLALALSGGLAGLVGVNEVMGYQHKVIEGFSPGYGFTGIAVALLARNHPVGILATAFLFGALHNSARELEFVSDKVTKELSLVLQGILIAVVAAEPLIQKLLDRRRLERKKAKQA